MNSYRFFFLFCFIVVKCLKKLQSWSFSIINCLLETSASRWFYKQQCLKSTPTVDTHFHVHFKILYFLMRFFHQMCSLSLSQFFLTITENSSKLCLLSSVTCTPFYRFLISWISFSLITLHSTYYLNWVISDPRVRSILRWIKWYPSATDRK